MYVMWCWCLGWLWLCVFVMVVVCFEVFVFGYLDDGDWSVGVIVVWGCCYGICWLCVGVFVWFGVGCGDFVGVGLVVV